MMNKKYIALIAFLLMGLGVVAYGANERKVDAGYVQFKGQATANTPAAGFYNFFVDSDDDVPKYRNSAGNYIDTLMTSFAQTVTGLKSFDVGIAMKEIATPANPSATYYKLYFKNDGNLYKLNSSGVEAAFTTGGATGCTWQTDTYSSATTTTWTCPAGAQFAIIDMAGGGAGGSSGYDNGSTRNGGAGGGGGAYGRFVFKCTPSDVYDLVIGAAGAGAVNSGAGGQIGTAGGDTYINAPSSVELFRVGGGLPGNSGTGGAAMLGGAGYFNGGDGGNGGTGGGPGTNATRRFYGPAPGTAGLGGGNNGVFSGGGGGGSSLYGGIGGAGATAGTPCTAGTRGGGGGGTMAGASGSGNGCAGGPGFIEIKTCKM